VTTDALARRYRDDGWWRPDRLVDDVGRWVAKQAHATAVVDGDRRLTWQELWDAGGSTAAALSGAGVEPGDIVSAHLPNGADVVVLHLACERLGAVHNPHAVQFREHEIDQVFGLLGSRVVLHPGATPAVDYGRVHANTDAARAGRTLAAADVLGPSARERGPVPATSPARPDDTAFILNTSGTVSMKGVMHTHEDAGYSERTVADLLGLGPDDTFLCGVPMSWGAGLCWGVRFALRTGATLVSMERWDARLAAQLVDRERVSYLYGPPTVARDLVALAAEWRPGRRLTMICAGAPIPRQLCVDARDRAGIDLVPGYGQTEHLHSTLGRRGDPLEMLTGTYGRALPGVECRAVDDDGVPCPPGQPGEILVQGPNVAAGYHGRPDLTEQTFRPDGWQVTQDIGSFDAAGSLRVVGRKRDLIIRGGLNVSPREVEELLLRIPGVADAAVVGWPDERYGERICAFLVSNGTPPTVSDLATAFADMGVARYKTPERVERIDALPLTTTGKVRHAALRELLATLPDPG
jgi:acyl-CoA synthetase (AMP-forming)/AMP-acid ligase II